jgi:hypothetical protein
VARSFFRLPVGVRKGLTFSFLIKPIMSGGLSHFRQLSVKRQATRDLLDRTPFRDFGTIIGIASRRSKTPTRGRGAEHGGPLYSGNLNCPSTRKVCVTTAAPVWGCPPPAETVYSPWTMTGSPASVTMLRSRGPRSK